MKKIKQVAKLVFKIFVNKQLPFLIGMVFYACAIGLPMYGFVHGESAFLLTGPFFAVLGGIATDEDLWKL